MSDELPAITYVRDLDESFEYRQTHARLALRGREVRAARGAYVGQSDWEALDELRRYLVTIKAVSETRRHGMVLSHWSAAAIHGLPVLGHWPTRVHVTIGRVSGGRSRNDVVKHALELSDEDVTEVDGFLVTTVARTVLDMAVSAGRLNAVMMADRALLVDRYSRRPHMLTRTDLWACYVARGNFRGRRRARAIIEFASSRAESALESVSRANMWAIDCPRPILQQPFSDTDGYIGDSDFYWKEVRLAGEADGRAKYLDASVRGERDLEQVLMAEKYREDRIRAIGERVTRWPWEVGVNPHALRTHLRRAGLSIP